MNDESKVQTPIPSKPNNNDVSCEIICVSESSSKPVSQGLEILENLSTPKTKPQKRRKLSKRPMDWTNDSESSSEEQQINQMDAADESLDSSLIPMPNLGKRTKTTKFNILKSPARKSLLLPENKSFSSQEDDTETEKEDNQDKNKNEDSEVFDLSDLSDSFCMQRIDSDRPVIDLKPVRQGF